MVRLPVCALGRVERALRGEVVRPEVRRESWKCVRAVISH